MPRIPFLPSRDSLRGLWRKAQRLLHWHSRVLRWLVFAGLAVLALLAAAWQFYFVPRLDSFRPALEQQLSAASGSRITMTRLAGGWRGIRPHLAIDEVLVHAPAGGPALRLSRVEAELSWWALLIGELQFRRLTLDAPQLAVSRDGRGRWRIAGFELAANGKGDHQLIDWLLDQREVEIRHGELQWHDGFLGREPQVLRDVGLRLTHLFGRHRLELGLQLPATLGDRLALTADWRGEGVAQWSAWRGEVALQLKRLDLGMLAEHWPAALPVARLAGRVDGRVMLGIAAGRLTALDGELLLQGLRLTRNERRLVLPRFDGKFAWQEGKGGQQLRLTAERIVAEGGVACERCSLRYEANPRGRQLALSGWRMAPLLGYRGWLPADWRQRLAPLQAGGHLVDAAMQWQPDWQHYSGRVRLKGASLAWDGAVQRLAGLELEADFDERGGSASLRSRQLQAELPRLFVEPLKLSHFELAGSWRRDGAAWVVDLKRLAAANADIALGASASYRYDGNGPGTLDLTGTLSRLNASRVYAYLPRVVGEQTLDWLTGALKAGEAYDGRIRVRGPLARFPFAGDADGQFRITAKARGVALDYAPGWPMLIGIAGGLDFHGQRMDILASQATIGRVPLREARVSIPDLGADEPHLLASGQSMAATRDFLDFLRASPLQAMTRAYVDGLKAEGQGELTLGLDIPLLDAEAARVSGRYRFRDNLLDFGGAIPALQAARGVIAFTDGGLTLQDGEAKALGGTSRFSGSVQGGDFVLQLAGRANLREAWQRYGLPQPGRISGSVDYGARLTATDQGYHFELESPLRGARLTLPAPLAKSPGEARPLLLRVSSNGSGEQLELVHGKLLRLALTRSAGDWRGVIGLGESLPRMAAPAGIVLGGGWPELDLDGWRMLLGGDEGEAPPLAGVQLAFDRVKTTGRVLHHVRLLAQRHEAGWQGSVQADEAQGHFQWRSAGGEAAPQLELTLSRLSLPLARDGNAVAAGASAAAQPGPAVNWPSLRLQVDDFRYEARELGRLGVQATPQAGSWRLNEVTLRNDDGTLTMNGLWRRSEGRSRVSGRFEIDSPDFGRLLGRLGYPDTVKRAPGSLSGEASWDGVPFPPDLASMQGSLRLDVAAGQFARIEPGAARLLSVLSLQSLVRRVKLDFRDVFSDGFEFDQIKGEATIEKGVARTQNLTIAGPGAQVLFRGEANIVAGTQKLRVRIVPLVGDTVAIAAGVVNPLAGVAAFLLQRVLKDPLGNLIAYEYDITGSMRDPQVTRVRSPQVQTPEFGKPR